MRKPFPYRHLGVALFATTLVVRYWWTQLNSFDADQPITVR